ncbi:MAG: class I SAM-dependent methyltransferase [Sedimentisphaerales bacterium]|nr:class I SAM-dependent methyltransferase [Sedimentisphaerales bacterium]
MSVSKPIVNFYDKIKPRLHQRIGQELRLAYRVLDLGCGACELIRYLSRTYNQKVTGVDISSNSFPKRRGVSKDAKNIRYIRKDAAKLSFIRSKTIDAVVIFWALHEMEKPQSILRQARRVLRPGGKIIIVEFPRNSLARKLWDEDYYTSRQLTAYLRKAGFEEICIRKIERKQVLWVTGFRSKNVR